LAGLRSQNLSHNQTTERILAAAGAYLAATRGSGWSPTVEQEARCAARCLNPNQQEFIVFDAGANVGHWLQEFRKLVSVKTRMYAFEPQPTAAAKIRQLNLPDCEVLEVALGEQPGKMTFYTSHDTDTMGSLYERADTYAEGKQYHETEVIVLRLDDFVKQRGIDRIDFMKMDLEGGEFGALNGATECMRTGVLHAFSFEFGISNVNSRVFFRDIYDLVAGHRYDIFRVTPAGRFIQLRSYTEDDESFARTSTFVARRTGSAGTGSSH